MDRAVPCSMERTDTRSFLTRERNRAGHTADPRPEVCPRDLWWRTSLRLSKECLKLGRLRPGRDTRRLQPRGEEGVANVQQRGWGVDGHHRRSSRPQAQRARTSPSTAATHLDGQPDSQRPQWDHPARHRPWWAPCHAGNGLARWTRTSQPHHGDNEPRSSN